MDVQLVVTDLDGTLWHVAPDIHERTRDALARLDALGIPLLVATGRRVGSTRAPLREAGLAPPAVVLNGSLGIDLHTGDRFHLGGFRAEEAVAMLDVFRRHDIDPCVYVDNEDPAVWISERPSTHPKHVTDFGADVRCGDLQHVVEHEYVLGFSVLGIDETVAHTLGDALATVGSSHVDQDRYYGGFSVTAAPSTQSKWNGVESYCTHHGLDATAVLAIGDGPNDRELLDNAAIAVAPEDAHPEARARADHVVGRAADGGWADILDLVS